MSATAVKKRRRKSKPGAKAKAKKIVATPAELPKPVFPGEEAELISAVDLCEETGFTDSWHRKVAARGYFPPPVDGRYRRKEAIRGLFNYQRELTDEFKKSLAAKHEILLDKKIEEYDLNLGVKRGEYKPTVEIASTLRAIIEQQKAKLKYFLEDRSPAVNAGLDAAAQRKNNRGFMVDFCREMQEWADKFAVQSIPKAEKKKPSKSSPLESDELLKPV